MTRDPLALLRDADPCPRVAPYDPERAKELLDRAVTGTRPAPRRRGRTARATGAAVVAALLAGGGGAAYAVFRQPPDTALTLSCAAGTTEQEFTRAGGLSSYGDTTSGDPVADCATEYERLGGVAPPLRGYTTGEAYLSVVPEDWPVPKAWKPLADGFRNDPARLELRQRLGDAVDGPEARCRSAADVEAMARDALGDLGLTGWTVERLDQAERADGRDWCALAFLDDGGERLVRVQGLPAPTAGDVPVDVPFGRFLQALRRDVAGACLALPDARRVTEQASRSAGFDPGVEAQVTALEDAGAACTRVDAPVAGLVQVTLRGPEVLPPP